MHHYQQQQPVPIPTQMIPAAVFIPSSDIIPQQPTPGYVVVQRTVNLNVVESYKSQQSRRLGITLVIIGCLAFVFNVVGLVSNDVVAIVGHGIWCGFIFITAGSIGIAASSKNRTTISGFMVTAIISALSSFSLFGIAIAGAAYYNGCYYFDDDCDGTNDLAFACEVILACLGFVAAIVSIWSSVNCGRALFRGSSTQGVSVPTPYGNQQRVSSQQSGAVPYGNQQPTAVTVSPPPYELHPVSPRDPGYPGDYRPTMHQHQYQYGYNMASATEHPGFAAAIPSPPGYSEFDDHK